jgi:hypothetical protein
MASVIKGKGSEGSCEDGVGKTAEITWRWATAADMQALRLLHFQAEVASGWRSALSH